MQTPAPEPSKTANWFQLWPVDDPLGKLPPGLPIRVWRVRLQYHAAKMLQTAYTLWCEFRSLVGRMRCPHRRMASLTPKQHLEQTSFQSRREMNIAISASIDYIKSVEATLPWASVFDLSLAMRSWAAGADWSARTLYPRTDSCTEQRETPA